LRVVYRLYPTLLLATNTLVEMLLGKQVRLMNAVCLRVILPISSRVTHKCNADFARGSRVEEGFVLDLRPSFASLCVNSNRPLDRLGKETLNLVPIRQARKLDRGWICKSYYRA
jgi:hypothetical protein